MLDFKDFIFKGKGLKKLLNHKTNKNKQHKTITKKDFFEDS